MDQLSFFDIRSCVGAEFSPCGKYRYKLWHVWDSSKPVAMCIGLNPSTANAYKPDPTIRLLIKMLNILDYGGFYMTNLFGLISSKPEALLTCQDPQGDNERILLEVRELCDDIIVCWGSFPQAEKRIQEVLPMFPQALCFGFNENGTPWHPRALSYKGLSKTPELIPYHQKKGGPNEPPIPTNQTN